MDIVFLLFEILIGFSESIIILLVFMAATNNKISSFLPLNKKVLIFPFFYTAFSFWARASLPMGYHTLAIAIFIVFMLSFFTSTKLSKCTYILFIISTIIVSTEMISQILMNLITSSSYAMILGNIRTKIMFSSIAQIMQYTIVIFLYKFHPLKKKVNSTVQKESTSVQFLLLQTFFISTIFFSINYAVGIKEHIVQYNILTALLFLFFIIVSYFQFNELINLSNIKNRFEVQEKHLVNMESIISIIRKEKHDFANHLNTIHAICTLNKPDSVDKAKEYINNLGVELQLSYHFYNSGNDYVDGLLVVKSNEAFTKNIAFEAEFTEPLSLINVKDHILVSIISNILDNALEAFDNILQGDINNENQKIISILGSVVDNKYCISISDNGPMIQPEIIDKIFIKGFSTKKGPNKHDHGFGLYITSQLIHNNKGTINVNSDEFETEFQVFFNI